MSLRIQYGNTDIEILFDYPVDRDFTRHRRTQVTIRFNDKPIAVAQTCCNPIDNFSRSVGRKLALTRAIKIAKDNGTINKDVSKKIWETYRQCCK